MLKQKEKFMFSRKRLKSFGQLTRKWALMSLLCFYYLKEKFPILLSLAWISESFSQHSSHSLIHVAAIMSHEKMCFILVLSFHYFFLSTSKIVMFVLADYHLLSRDKNLAKTFFFHTCLFYDDKVGCTVLLCT